MTGRSSLFVSELMTVEIEDVPAEESQELLDILFEHQRRSEFVYAHSWRPGDPTRQPGYCPGAS
jgi:taurine dioxygenase